MGDLKWFIWCGVWVIWNSFLQRSVGDQERGFLVQSVVIWNGFLVRSVGDLEWFSAAECG